jgi:hypothetical protein
MVIVRTPNPTFDGERVGFRFKNGEARMESLSGKDRQALRRLGYEIEDRGSPNDLSGLTVLQLRQVAESRGVDLSGLTRKADILQAIEPSM